MGVSPSGYYRIQQYVDRLNIDYQVYNISPCNIYKKFLNLKNKSFIKAQYSIFLYILMVIRISVFLTYDLFVRKPNKIIICRALLPRYLPSHISFMLLKFDKKIVWDFDDDILISKEISKKEFKKLSRLSKTIVVTHDYLKNKVNEHYRDKVYILHTTDGDFNKIDPISILNARKNNFDKEIKIVWTGTAGNLINIEKVIPYLEKASENIFYSLGKKVTLFILSNKRVSIKTSFLSIKNVQWSRKTAVEYISNSHIGIMPLINSEYALGKGGFKLVQYMAASLPVIGSNIGFNKEIIDSTIGEQIIDIEDSTEWIMSLKKIASYWDTYEGYAKKSKKKWDEKFNYEFNLKCWQQLLNF